jgi:hypothetical protein
MHEPHWIFHPKLSHCFGNLLLICKRAKIELFQFFKIFFFRIFLVENVIFFVAKICASKAIRAVGTVFAKDYVLAVVAVRAKRCLEAVGKHDAFVAKLALGQKEIVDAIFADVHIDSI